MASMFKEGTTHAAFLSKINFMMGDPVGSTRLGCYTKPFYWQGSRILHYFYYTTFMFLSPSNHFSCVAIFYFDFFVGTHIINAFF